MIEIFEVIIDIFLLRADSEHRKKIEEQEKKDNIKRPFRKIFLKPSLVTLYYVAFIASIIAVSISWYRDSKLPEQTRIEMKEMRASLLKRMEVDGSFPSSLEELIEGRPLRKDWLTDSWKRPYHYSVFGAKYVLISAGADGILGNQDDIIID